MKVLVQSRGVVGKGMASPGVRSFHTARVLAEQLPEAEVTLSVPNQPDIESPHPRLKLEPYGGTRHGFRQMQDADVIVSRNFPPMVVPLFMEKKLALDFFTPFFIEWMELSKRIGRKGQRNMWVSSNRHYSDMQLTLADFVFCSNERQRDLWVGAMSSLGLVTPEVYEKDDKLEHLVSVIPYGVQSGSPQHKEQVLKGVIPGINPDDKVVIWNGLIVEWFDADTVVRAMAKVAEKRPDVKLFFLGTNHPDFVTSVDAPPVVRAMNIAKEFGIFDKNVFFNVGWVPYEDIGNYLTESDIGICAGYQNLESRYSFRTRFMDLFWSELPIVCTTGDVLADHIAKDPLGVAVAPGDADAMAAGILRLVEDQAFYDQCAGNMPAIKEELSWERTLQPLVDFCRDDEMWAVPKKDRLVPLLRRTAAYLGQKSLVPFARW
jgi:glycosyltransferase involved in cell wall biosynthesis